MDFTQDKNIIWFDAVIAPKLQVLGELSRSTQQILNFDHKTFLKEFLQDLELLKLDSFYIEIRIEKISAALDLVQELERQKEDCLLKDIAFIAFLNNPFDRILFYNKWRKYTRFKKSHQTVSDDAILDALRLPVLLRKLVLEIQKLSAEMKNEVNESQHKKTG